MKRTPVLLLLLACLLLAWQSAPKPNPAQEVQRRLTALEDSLGQLERRMESLQARLAEANNTQRMVSMLESRLDRLQRQVEDLSMRVNRP